VFCKKRIRDYQIIKNELYSVKINRNPGDFVFSSFTVAMYVSHKEVSVPLCRLAY
jgi:hypothetical protein